jgi:uncharacterized RDD family membrane protein YckC
MAAADAPADDIGAPHVVPYAGVATRTLALTLDVIIAQAIALLGFGVLAVIASLVSNIHFDTLEKLLAAAGWALTVAIYFVAFWSLTGKTPGMQLMRIRVVGPDGDPPSVPRSIVRLVLLILCIIPLFLGFVSVLFDDRRRGVHDMLARTLVLYAP